MTSFEELLQRELSQQVKIKGTEATVSPMEAMIKSVTANAMRGRKRPRIKTNYTKK